MTFSLEERADGIIYMRLSNSSQETVDTWYTTTFTLDRQHALAGQPIFTLLDLREMGMPSPYALARAIQSGYKTPGNVTQRIAVLVASGLVADIGRGIVQRIPHRLQLTVQLFVNEAKALAWLNTEREALKQEIQKASKT